MNGWLGFDSLGALLTPGRRHVCQAGSRQILDDFVNQETRKHLNDFLTPRLIVRKTFNQGILRSRCLCCLAGYRVAWFKYAGNRLLQLLSPTAGQLKFLERMLDEDGRNDA
jgi:hypothetical protein